MTTTLTLELMRTLFPNGKYLPAITSALNQNMSGSGIETTDQVAQFIAQTGHESGGYCRFVENLNYTADQLRTNFPKYFPDKEIALAYHKKPEQIANRIYADRLGNGGYASGDGYRYRGRGIIQLTGKRNYEKFGATIGKTARDVADYLLTPEGAVESSLWFWKTNNLAALGGDVAAVTLRVNGGTHGLKERKFLFGKTKAELLKLGANK